jgi:hypothetical protein
MGPGAGIERSSIGPGAIVRLRAVVAMLGF